MVTSNRLLFADFHFEQYRVKFSGAVVTLYLLDGEDYHLLTEIENTWQSRGPEPRACTTGRQYTPCVTDCLRVIRYWKEKQ